MNQSGKNKRSKKGVVAKIALGLTIGAGAVFLLAAAPGLAGVLLLLDRNPRKAAKKLERGLERLLKRGLIEKVGEKSYRPTSAGKQMYAHNKFDEYEFPALKKWNGQWSLICFDIPETMRHKRRMLWLKLDELGFYPLQNSVLVTYHPSEELVSLVHEGLGLKQYVRLVVAKHIDNEITLRKHFKLPSL